ncbi:hypothetical protein A1O3_01440 [Capronia epimyces CBS 606.96]|uniref:Fe2OG dioxygenase domain-containing protein n=1 Tax=Capronia epimyces CBS 606.96 TaxID=1182542 RepID=W9YUG9_9EURO|nr:uncharacterized protein A1O3_01440 [Capronia epimyces CBS 606.96]EXJ92886.1 hypothetical protein A1O3_01440 [Capronia epimyces CBS 606.96]
MDDEEEEFIPPPPPPGPPPLLREDQLLHLARQGWLFLELPDALSQSMTDLLRHSSQYFDAPDIEKKELYPSKLGTEFGYYPIAEEKEYITLRCRIHTDPNAKAKPAAKLAASLEASTVDAWHHAGVLLWRILCDIARASDLDVSVWNDILDGTLDMPDSEDQLTYALMRLFRYFPSTGHAEEHTDLGLLTLCIGDGTGLQVLDRFNSDQKPAWVDGPVGTHTATVLVGQTLRALSARTMTAGAHRVVGNSQGRQSVVFALRHSTRHDVDFSLFGGEGKLHPTELWKTIQAGKVNINTEKEKRDAQRARFRTTRPGAEAEALEHATRGQG